MHSFIQNKIDISHIIQQTLPKWAIFYNSVIRNFDIFCRNIETREISKKKIIFVFDLRIFLITITFRKYTGVYFLKKINYEPCITYLNNSRKGNYYLLGLHIVLRIPKLTIK